MARSAETIRSCALTRTELPATELIRFAVSPDNQLVPDVDGKAPGRGVWITLSAAAVEEAVRKKVFARSLKAQIDVPDDLALLTRTRLEQRLAGALGLARKAGCLLTGATKVASSVEGNKVVALFTATDAAPDSRRKMMQAVRRSERTQPLPHFEVLASDQLGLALGLENVIHAALVPGAAANSAVERAKRLARYTASDREEDDTI